MLVISRQERESVVLCLPGGNQVVISIEELRRGKVKLGFVAPPSVKILRSELPAQSRVGFPDKKGDACS